MTTQLNKGHTSKVGSPTTSRINVIVGASKVFAEARFCDDVNVVSISPVGRYVIGICVSNMEFAGV